MNRRKLFGFLAAIPFAPLAVQVAATESAKTTVTITSCGAFGLDFTRSSLMEISCVVVPLAGPEVILPLRRGSDGKLSCTT